MRKLILYLIISILAMGSNLFAFALIGNETVYPTGEGYDGFNYVSDITFRDGYIGWGETGTWGHTLSSAYMPVPDDWTVDNATLEVTGWRHTSLIGTEVVQVGGTFRWTGIQWTFGEGANELFDLTNIDDSYWNSDPLNISVTPLALFWNCGFTVDRSTLSVNYAPSSGQVSAVPEPTSFILLGLGIVGLMSRRRKQ